MQIKYLKILLLPLKIKGDDAMPTSKKNMLRVYHEWKECMPPVFNAAPPLEEDPTRAATSNPAEQEVIDGLLCLEEAVI